MTMSYWYSDDYRLSDSSFLNEILIKSKMFKADRRTGMESDQVARYISFDLNQVSNDETSLQEAG